MKIKTISIAITLLGVVAFYSCRKDYTYVPKPVNPNIPVRFATDIVPIFTGGCILSGCHNGGLPPDLTAANAYNSLFVSALSGIPVDTVANASTPENNLLYQKVKASGTMNQYLPKPTDAELILAWIKQGAKNN